MKILDNNLKNIIKKYEKIEFVGYDYPYKTEEKTLTDYNIRNINIRHKNNEIIISFNKEDFLLGIGITIFKYENINNAYINECLGYIKYKNNKIEFMFNDIEIIEKIYKIEEDKFEIVIESKKYNLLLEKSIIPYYNLEEEYDDIVLEEILKKIPSMEEGLEKYNEINDKKGI